MRGYDPEARRDRALPIMADCAEEIGRIMEEDYRGGALDYDRALMLARAVHAMFLECTAMQGDASTPDEENRLRSMARIVTQTGFIVADLDSENADNCDSL